MFLFYLFITADEHIINISLITVFTYYVLNNLILNIIFFEKYLKCKGYINIINYNMQKVDLVLVHSCLL